MIYDLLEYFFFIKNIDKIKIILNYERVLNNSRVTNKKIGILKGMLEITFLMTMNVITYFS